jgi:hypothetical protein
VPRKRPPKPKLVQLAERIAEARRIIDAEEMLLEKLRIAGVLTREDEGALRTYISSLTHLLVHEHKEKEAEANKTEANKTEANKTEAKLHGGQKKGRPAAYGLVDG